MRRTIRPQLTTAVVLCLSAMAAGGCSSKGGMKRGSASGDGLNESLHGLLPSSEYGGDAAAESCRQHADCQSLVCDTYAAAGQGRCIDAGRVLYVDVSHCGTPDGGTGTREDPFCQIRTAVTAAPPSRDVIRVMPGQYFPFSVAGKRLLIFGPAGENGVARVFEEDTGTVRVSEGSDALVDGFALGGPSTSALSCNSTPGGARVAVRRSTLSADSGIALNITGCDVEVDRVQIRAAFGGITLTNSRYGIENAFVTGSSERVAIVPARRTYQRAANQRPASRTAPRPHEHSARVREMPESACAFDLLDQEKVSLTRRTSCWQAKRSSRRSR